MTCVREKLINDDNDQYITCPQPPSEDYGVVLDFNVVTLSGDNKVEVFTISKLFGTSPIIYILYYYHGRITQFVYALSVWFCVFVCVCVCVCALSANRMEKVEKYELGVACYATIYPQ